MDAVGISRVAVGDEDEALFRSGGANGFAHGDGRRERAAGVGDMISGNLPTAGGDEEKGIAVLTADFDVGFIAGAVVIDLAFMGQIEKVAIISGGLGIIEHGLIGDGDAEDLPKHLCGFAGADGKGDVEGQNQPDQMRRVMNVPEVHA